MHEPKLMLVLLMVLVANIICILLLFRRGRRENIRMLLACVGITLVIQTLRYFVGDPLGILDFAPGMLYLPSLYFIHDGNMSQKIFVTFSVLVLTYTIFLLVSFLSGGSLMLQLLLLAGALLVYVILMARRGRQLVSEVFLSAGSRAWRGYALYAAVYYIVLFRLYGFNFQLPAEPYARLFYYALPIFALVGFILFFTAILRTHEKATADYELQMARQSISAGREYYENLTNALGEIKVMRHDYKQQLGVIATLLEEGQPEEAHKVFRSTHQRYEASLRDTVVYCENPVLSALISYHAALLEEAQAEFYVSAQIGAEIPLDNYELCVVIGNLLENAREAVLHLPPAQRRVSLKVISDQVKLAIELSNCFDGIMETSEDAMPLSRKADGGQGLPSVKAVCDLHDGVFRQSWNQEQYTVYIVLNY